MTAIRIFGGIVLLAVTAAAQEPLTSLSSVMSLPFPKAGDSLPVQVEATVTFLDTPFGGIFVHDGEQGIYLRLPPAYLTNQTIHTGDRLRVKAVTGAGDYTPVLNCESLTVEGIGTMPKPILVTPENLFSPSLDSQWVQVSGVITSLETDDASQFVFTFDMYGWTMKVLVPWSKEAVPEAANLMQRRVTLLGVAATVFNGRRQMTGRYFCVPSLKFFQLLSRHESKNQPEIVAIDHLLRTETTPEDLVRVRGIVTHSVKNELYLHDAGGSLRVLVAGGERFHPGDVVEVEGFASIVPFSPILRARSATQLGRIVQPSPQQLPEGPVTWNKLVNLQMELVTTEAEYLGVNENPDETILHCRLNNFIFEAHLPKPHALATGLVPNCWVKLTGICELTTTHQMPRAGWVDGFRINLRGADDLLIIRRPSWWTTQRLIVALAISIGLGIIAQIWIWFLRRQVSVQTKIIGTKIERESMLNERQRIARDLHDTLEQQMTGVGLQIAHAEEQIAGNPNQAQAALRLARKMVRYCCDEANRTVRDLRSVLLEERGLAGAIQEALTPLMAAGTARLVFEVQGTPTRLDAVVETNLLHLAQEAVANAVQHAAAVEIKVAISYTPDFVTITIKDDGCGFDSSNQPLEGHFGLMGMQERANKMKGTFFLESISGKGTAVRVTVLNVAPLEPEKSPKNHEED